MKPKRADFYVTFSFEIRSTCVFFFPFFLIVGIVEMKRKFVYNLPQNRREFVFDRRDSVNKEMDSISDFLEIFLILDSVI